MAKRVAAAPRRSKGTAGVRASAKKAKSTSVARRKTAARAAATRTRRKPAAASPSTLGSAGTVLLGAARETAVAVARRLPWKKDAHDPFLLLEKDHRRFEALLKQGEETTTRASKRRRELLDTLTRELDAHELMEEQVLYPALEPHAETREIVLEGYEEHHVADLVTRELRKVKTNDERWAAKFKVFKESLEHHIREEEQTMFRTARAVLSHAELHELGVRMKALKGEGHR